MIEFTINKDGGYINQWCAPPTVYLDHWAWIKISKNEILAERFSRALKARNGTLAFSWLNIIEFSKVANEEHARKANELLDAIWPQVFVLYPNFFKVIEQEEKEISGGERFALHGDIETLRSILKIRPLTPNSLSPLRTPKLFDLATKTGITFDDNADFLIKHIASWRQDYCNKPEFNSAVNRTPKAKKAEFGTRFIARELLGSFIKDEGLQIGKGRRNHAMDLSHAIVPVAYCEYVLLDNYWASQVELARKRIRDGGGVFPMAKVFSEKEDGLVRFIQDLESVATCQKIETK